MKYFSEGNGTVKLVITMAYVVVAIISFLLIYSCSDSYSIKTFKINGGYTIDIRTDSNWEISKPIYCRVTKNGELTVSEYLIGGTIGEIKDLHFEVIGNNKDVFALIEKSSPYVVLAIFNFNDKKYWPFRATTQNNEDTYIKGKELLRQLNSDNNEYKYVLSTDIPGNVDLKVRP